MHHLESTVTLTFSRYFLNQNFNSLPPQFRRISSSSKGLKMTSDQLLAKKPRCEPTLKLKSDMIDEAKKLGFKHKRKHVHGKVSTAYNFFIE